MEIQKFTILLVFKIQNKKTSNTNTFLDKFLKIFHFRNVYGPENTRKFVNVLLRKRKAWRVIVSLTYGTTSAKIYQSNLFLALAKVAILKGHFYDIIADTEGEISKYCVFSFK